MQGDESDSSRFVIVISPGSKISMSNKNSFRSKFLPAFKAAAAWLIILSAFSQAVFTQTDQTTPLHLLKPDYPIPYGIPKTEEVASVLNRVQGYLDSVTPVGFINEKT